MTIRPKAPSAVTANILDLGRHSFAPPISAPVHPPKLPIPSVPSIPFAPKAISITDAHLFGAMARGIGLRANPAAYALHIDAVEMLFGRHLNFANGQLHLDFAGYTGLPLIDFMQKGFTGLVGYGLSTLAANDSGYVWHSHYEEAKKLALPPGRDFSFHHKPWDKIHGHKSPQTRSVLRRPDLVSLKSGMKLGIIECKGTLSDPIDKFWRYTVFEAFMEQSEPFLGSSISGLTVGEVLVFCGQLANTSASGFVSMHSQLPPSTGVGGQIYNALRPIILPHYRTWLRLMGEGFWSVGTSLHRRIDFQTPSIRIIPSPTSQVGLDFVIDGNSENDSPYVLGMLKNTYDVLTSISRLDVSSTEGYDYDSPEQVEVWNFDSDQDSSQNILAELNYTLEAAQLSREFTNSTGGALFADGTVVVKKEFLK